MGGEVCRSIRIRMRFESSVRVVFLSPSLSSSSFRLPVARFLRVGAALQRTLLRIRI